MNSFFIPLFLLLDLILIVFILLLNFIVIVFILLLLDFVVILRFLDFTVIVVFILVLDFMIILLIFILLFLNLIVILIFRSSRGGELFSLSISKQQAKCNSNTFCMVDRMHASVCTLLCKCILTLGGGKQLYSSVSSSVSTTFPNTTLHSSSNSPTVT